MSNATNLTIGKVYLCKYNKASYSVVFEVRPLRISPNGLCVQYERRTGDLHNANSHVVAWVEASHFWQQYEELDSWDDWAA